ncbi:PREDICTED: pirin-like isoform X2 [Priapulus caudatus]|nr:PREDICTED: pirin-like isoform X2 [Priapulus caudatus]
MLDEFCVTWPAGFPDHPHRGFETVTYMISGATEHEDFVGHKGVIKVGDVQWMTAGRGVMHSEMPHGDKEAIGLQLWVNLKKTDKMVQPSYQELKDADIPKVTSEGVTVKIIAGETMGVKSQVRTLTPSYYFDISMEKGAHMKLPLPKGWTTFVYTLTGTVQFGPSAQVKEVEEHSTVVFEDGEMVEAQNKGDKPARFVLLSGQPIGEPVVQHGPFVMNTAEDIQATIKDYHNTTNGFERARKWKSRSGNRLLQSS